MSETQNFVEGSSEMQTVKSDIFRVIQQKRWNYLTDLDAGDKSQLSQMLNILGQSPMGLEDDCARIASQIGDVLNQLIEDASLEQLASCAKYAKYTNDPDGFTARLKEKINACTEWRVSDPSHALAIYRVCSLESAAKLFKANTAQMLTVYSSDDQSLIVWANAEVQKLWDEIVTELEQYFTLAPNFMNTELTVQPKDVHAAMELRKGGYDCVIGIARGGSPLAHACEIAGMHTAYIKPARDEDAEGKCEWLSEDRTIEEKMRNGTILLCENDSTSGTALRDLGTFLAPYEPECIDVCFDGGYLSESKQETYDVDGLDDYFGVSDLPHERMIENLQEFLVLIKAKNAELQGAQ